MSEDLELRHIRVLLQLKSVAAKNDVYLLVVCWPENETIM